MKNHFSTSRPPGSTGFSLVELVVAITVMSVIAVVIMPIITTSTDAYASARDTRAETDRVLYALERTVRVVREAPFAADESGLDVQTATDSALIFNDGSGFRLSGTDLEFLQTGGDSSVLCRDVQAVQLTYYDNTGNPMGVIDPGQIHRVNLQLTCNSITLEMYALPRAWIGRGS